MLKSTGTLHLMKNNEILEVTCWVLGLPPPSLKRTYWRNGNGQHAMSHLGVFLSTMETQLDKTTETLSTIVTAKVSLSKISALIDIL